MVSIEHEILAAASSAEGLYGYDAGPRPTGSDIGTPDRYLDAGDGGHPFRARSHGLSAAASMIAGRR